MTSHFGTLFEASKWFIMTLCYMFGYLRLGRYLFLFKVFICNKYLTRGLITFSDLKGKALASNTLITKQAIFNRP